MRSSNHIKYNMFQVQCYSSFQITVFLWGCERENVSVETAVSAMNSLDIWG